MIMKRNVTAWRPATTRMSRYDCQFLAIRVTVFLYSVRDGMPYTVAASETLNAPEFTAKIAAWRSSRVYVLYSDRCAGAFTFTPPVKRQDFFRFIFVFSPEQNTIENNRIKKQEKEKKTYDE